MSEASPFLTCAARWADDETPVKAQHDKEMR